jgi:hypothetical protein
MQRFEVGCSTMDGSGKAPTRVFWEKRLQAVENKGWGSIKESQEAARD